MPDTLNFIEGVRNTSPHVPIRNMEADISRAFRQSFLEAASIRPSHEGPMIAFVLT
jgi:hypothetical protein